MALWSTYQIPRREREQVFRELMRVGNHIHIGPIGKVDFDTLMRLAETQGFGVVACVGPGSVEKQWVAAHKNILMQIKETEKRAAFEATAETWRKVGKALGIASTVMDFGLSGLGLVFTGYDIHHWINNSDTRLVRKLITAGIGGTSAGIGILGGPTHLGTRLLAKEVELVGTIAAKAENYVGTGKLAEHTKVVGEVLNMGVKVAAKNPEIVPEKYRKTVEIIAEVSEKEEQARKAVDMQRSIQEKENLKREYQMWKDEMDPGLQSYYKLRGEWPPSTEEFTQHPNAPFVRTWVYW